ncbi:MAG: S8 family serine peptidase [Lachnospiraceae bacterium]|nr:S8 family serine peptidase [Lachnospiraceae bacterium]
MNNQKIENLLNLSLDSSMEERDKSLELNVGYEKEDKTWELIVKYHGDIARVASPLVKVEELINGYAIVTIPESLIEGFVNLEEIEYVEKPKRLFFNIRQAKEKSCILEVTTRTPFLSGKGVLVAIIDSGIDYMHMDFRNQDGTTRIVELWDQSMEADREKGWLPPEGFTTGVLFNEAQINEALQQPTRAATLGVVPSIDASGHGTSVAGIAAGNGNERGNNYQGVAPESTLIIVKLGTPQREGFPRTTELMRALTFVVNRAIYYGKPVAVNLSFGNTYGAHNGSSLLERFMDNVSEIGKSVICVGSGNEGAAAGHVAGSLQKISSSEGGSGISQQFVELAVAPYERTINVQLWKNYVDEMTVTILAPDGSRIPVQLNQSGKQTLLAMNTTLLVYVGEPTPYSVNQEIYFDFIPNEQYIDSGIWTFIMEPVRVVSGEYYYYLPSENVLNSSTRFYRPTAEVTLTIPSTAQKVITVGAYNSIYDSYADFSGRGYVDKRYELIESGGSGIKPDLVAPGVDLITTSRNGGYINVTGTSFATPMVTGAAALLLEWGIVKGNDAYLYGEKVKAYLIKGARQLPGMESPNPMTGWGALCVKDSLPI